MYFNDRVQAGEMLAESFVEYRYEDTAVLALSPGGAVVGAEIAKCLRARMSLLLTEQISMPGVNSSDVIGLIDQEGHFTYNAMMPAGLIMEVESEMHNYLEAEKLDKMHKLSRAVNEYGFIDPQSFYGHHVIVVSDGFRNGLAFEAAANYLKTINTRKMIAASPIASVPAVDRLHVVADELKILDVLANYLDTDHYFEDNTIPDIQVIMDELIYRWK